MAIPSTQYDENSPAGSDNISAGDDSIRLFKTQIREVIAVDHEMISTQTLATGGQHKQVTLQEQADLGTGGVSATILGSQTVSGKGELVYTDEDDNDVQLTSAGGILATQMTGVYAAANVAAVATIGALLYPVGSVYANAAVSTNPSTLLGFGTWVAIEGECVVGLVAGGEFDTLGTVSEGATTVKLTGGESGTSAHTHGVQVNDGGGTGAVIVPELVGASGSEAQTSDASSEANADDAHNNIQPSYVAYVWRRTV